MLTAIGYHVSMTLRGKRNVAPRGLVLLYDFQGTDWPKTSVLLGNRPEGKPSRPGRSRYFGEGYEVMSTAPYEVIPGDRATVRDLKKWKFVGEVLKISYERGLEHPERWGGVKPAKDPDTKNPKGLLVHDFDKENPPGLFKRGKHYRLELLPGTKMTMRGFVEPGQ